MSRAAHIQIVCTYADEGSSGRASLQCLIAGVESGNTDFNMILVYDVSRWGQFQDEDESAYYEYICKPKGIAVAYRTNLLANGAVKSCIVRQERKIQIHLELVVNTASMEKLWQLR